MDIEPKRVKSKSVPTAVLMILVLSGTSIAATSSYLTDLVYAQQQANLNVVVRVVCNPPTPNCPSPSQFTIGVQGNNPNPSQFLGSSEGTLVTVDPGFVAVNVIGQPPAAPAGYVLAGFPQGCSGQAIAGQSLTCTITATYESATVNVAMRVVCNPPTPNCPSSSQFTIGVQGNNPNPSQFSGSSTGTNVMLGPGNFNVNVVNPVPPAPPGYILGGSRSGCSGLIGVAQTIQCIITATYFQPTTLRVIKQVQCPEGAVCPQPSQFQILATGNGAVPDSFAGSDEGTNVGLGLGRFSISEGFLPPNPQGLALAPIFSNNCRGEITTVGQELGNCVITNRYLQDADGDGISNIWETDGIDINNDGTIDYTLPGANPNHKNLWIEVDYMQFHNPIAQAINNVISAFNNAPVSNPDNSQGITLNVQTDEQIPHQDNINGVTALLEIKRDWFGTAAERAGANAANVLAAKAFTFHYGPFVHDRSDFPGSSGVSNGNPGMEFFVSLGMSGYGVSPSTGHTIGTRDQQEGTFMHEFGHNLGFGHGGGDEVNCKPNYLSVNNYLFQFSNLVSNRPLDFSRSALPTLNIGTLNEANGIGQSTPPSLTTIYNGPGGSGEVYQGPRQATAGTAIDFNFNGVIDQGAVFSDINGRLACGTPGPGPVLNGFNDWNNIRYVSGPGALPPLPSSPSITEELTIAAVQLPVQQLEEEVPEEQTIDTVRQSRLVLLEGIDNAILRLVDLESETESAAGPVPPAPPVPVFDTSHIAELLQTDQLDAAIGELIKLKGQVIKTFGKEDADREIVPQIDNLVGALEDQKYPTPPPASDCTGTGSRNSIIRGTPNPDTLIGTNGQNIISGVGGGDRINGCGGSDRISGNAEGDGIAGGPGNDDLNGSAGDDVIHGDSGNDRLAGGTGVNFLTGGTGRDLFICDPQGETYLTDFVFRTDAFTGPCILEDTTTTVAQAELERLTPSSASTLSSMPPEILAMPLPY